MGALLRTFGVMLGSFGAATVLSAAVVLGLLFSSGRCDLDQLKLAWAVVNGYQPKAAPPAPVVAPPAPSPDELAALRSVRLRDVEIREQALRTGVDSLEARGQEIAQAMEDYKNLRESFQRELAELRAEAASQGEENVRSIIAGIKPKQAKEQLLAMIEHNEMLQVVNLLSKMSASRKNEIVGEFKTPEESKELSEILRIMREGQPVTDLVQDTQANLEEEAEADAAELGGTPAATNP